MAWKNEAEAREQIKAMVAEYYHDFKEKKTPYQEGDRITYAARVFDEKEMCALTDATLDFWLTTGRFADQFEKEFAKWIGVKFAHLVNSGSSANLAAYFALLQPGDSILSMSLSNGAHLTHGSPVNFSGKLYDMHFYDVDEDGFIDCVCGCDRAPVQHRRHQARGRPLPQDEGCHDRPHAGQPV